MLAGSGGSLGERGEGERQGLGLQQHKHPGLEPVLKGDTSQSTWKQASRAPPTPRPLSEVPYLHPTHQETAVCMCIIKRWETPWPRPRPIPWPRELGICW